MSAATISSADKRDKSKETGGSTRFSREISIWALLARGSIYKIFLILVSMGAMECLLFFLSLNRALQRNQQSLFEALFDYSGAIIVFLAAMCLTVIVLGRCESENGGSRSGYTLNRLIVTDRRQMVIKLAYNIFCFILLFGVQAWIALWMCGMYERRMPGELVSPQLVFLAFYRSNFLHNILPLAESAKWVRNILMIFATSASLAVNRNRYFQFYALSVLPIACLLSDIGPNAADIVVEIAYVAVILDAVLRFLGIWRVDSSVQEEQDG